MAHQALRETREALGCRERKALVGSLGSQECQERRERRVIPVKCAQHCLKGSRTLWGSLESQGRRGNQGILPQPGMAGEVLDKKVIRETLAYKALKERRGSPVHLAP